MYLKFWFRKRKMRHLIKEEHEGVAEAFQEAGVIFSEMLGKTFIARPHVFESRVIFEDS